MKCISCIKLRQLFAEFTYSTIESPLQEASSDVNPGCSQYSMYCQIYICPNVVKVLGAWARWPTGSWPSLEIASEKAARVEKSTGRLGQPK